LSSSSSLSTDWEEELLKRLSEHFLPNGRPFDIIEWVKSHTQKVRQEERSLIRQLIQELPTKVKDPICLSGAKTRQQEILSALSQEE